MRGYAAMDVNHLNILNLIVIITATYASPMYLPGLTSTRSLFHSRSVLLPYAFLGALELGYVLRSSVRIRFVEAGDMRVELSTRQGKRSGALTCPDKFDSTPSNGRPEAAVTV